MIVENRRQAFGQRLKAALDAAGIPGGSERRKHVAQMFGVSREAVRQWLQGQTMPTTERIGEMAERLDVFGEWLLTGRGPMRADDTSRRPLSSESNVEPVPSEVRWVPLISWVQAGRDTEMIAQLKTGEYEDKLPCPVKCSQATFALRVRGESMEPEYFEGDIVYVDPSAKRAHRKDVVVNSGSTEETTLKRLIFEGELAYLKTLNPNYPEPIRQVTKHDRIRGVVVFSGRYR